MPGLSDSEGDLQQEKAEAAPAQLRRRLDLKDCMLLVIGSMVGSGIFLTTGQIAGTLSSPVLILLAWLVGGGMALCGALTYAELGAALPRAGGHYVYLREAYGPFVGFLDGWLSFVASFPGSIAFVALGMVAYLPSALSGHNLADIALFGQTLTLTSNQLIAIGIILSLSAINAFGLRAGSGAQNLLTGIKIAALVGVTAAGLALGRGDWSNLAAGPIAPAGVGLAAFGAALIGISFSYLGWDAPTYMAAEARQPERVLPRSILLGTLTVLALYIGFNVVLLYGLPAARLAASENAAREVVSRLLGASVSRWLTALVFICILGSLNATVMVGPRIYYAMARDGLFPAALGSVHRGTRVPVTAIAAQAIWSCIIVLSATLGRILAFTVLVIWLLSALTAGAVFVLRLRRPDLARPYRVWAYPWLPGLFCLSSLALAANHLLHTPSDLLWLLGFLAAGLLPYAALRRGAAPARRAGPASSCAR